MGSAEEIKESPFPPPSAVPDHCDIDRKPLEQLASGGLLSDSQNGDFCVVHENPDRGLKIGRSTRQL